MIGWNDRRKARKAASATTRAQISAMAKQGTIAYGGPKPSEYSVQAGKRERAAVVHEARNVGWEAGRDSSDRRGNMKTAAQRVSKDPEKYHADTRKDILGKKK